MILSESYGFQYFAARRFALGQGHITDGQRVDEHTQACRPPSRYSGIGRGRSRGPLAVQQGPGYGPVARHQGGDGRPQLRAEGGFVLIGLDVDGGGYDIEQTVTPAGVGGFR